VRDPTEWPLGRRSFLRVLGGAGAAGLAAGCSPKPAVQRIVPYLVPPEDVVPGKPRFYRTACRECGAGCGVTARAREGRAVKLEGNPEDPVGRGALCARGQAAIQDLYHPERHPGPLRRGEGGALAPGSWDDAEADLAKAIAAAAAKGPGRVRMLTAPEPGTGAGVQRGFLAAAGGRPSDRVVLDLLDPAPLRAAGAALLGRDELPVVDLSAARAVVALGADFLETWRSPVELARQLAEGRVREGDRTTLTWVGPRLSLTGVSADRWLRARSGGEADVVLGLLRVAADPAAETGRSSEARALWPKLAALAPDDLAARAGVPWSALERLGRELVARRPSAVLAPGPQSQGPAATRLAALALLLNAVLGNLGRTLRYGLAADADRPSSMTDVRGLLEACARGEVDVLLVLGVDPVGVLPASLGAAAALAKVPLVATTARRPDRTTPLARLVLPDHHPLEAFGDVAPRAGVLNLQQPVMTPLADTRQAMQVLLEVGGQLPSPPKLPSADPYDLVVARIGEAAASARPPGAAAPADPAAEVRAARERGGIWSVPAPGSAPALRLEAAQRFLAPEPPRAGAEGALDLVPELSPATAARLGLATGELATVATSAGRAELPVYVFPGIRDDAAGLPLGPEAVAILPATVDPVSGALAFAGARVTVTRVGKRTRLPVLEGSPYQHGREIVPVVSAAQPAPPRPDLSARMYEAPAHPEHRWAMAIDLDRCTGCEACVVACFAENNVPVMGREAAEQGRYMGWIRIERYLGDEPGGPLDVRLLPMLCQQCTNAPCEPVCPVYATYHTPEGLNAQIYNRCVGTRYCSNNCPYKVRTFNWRDAQFERPLDLQLNPDVTVRSRGVMEKCTFCIQRIRYGENQARSEGRKVRDGEIVPACAQSCPAQAITFGDANDPGSRVSRAARDRRAFRALEDVGTLPAITYLARTREEEPT
jgi:molybdopterin-containing oxidoreductase family iron-sulfur binding subunit